MNKINFFVLCLKIFFVFSVIVFISCKKGKDNKLPEVTTSDATNITSTSATVNGNIVEVGSENIINYGHCWSTSPNPTIDLATKTQFGAASSATTFNSSLINLLPNTKYYVRAYATISNSTVYSNEITITTLAATSFDVLTQNINVGNMTATVYGNVSVQGTMTVTQYGHCWSISNELPTTQDSKTIFSNAYQSTTFSSIINNISIKNTYIYVRAYATDGNIIKYGNTVIFFFPNNKFSFTDNRDGQSYQAIQIGNQIWMTENLNYATTNSWCYNNSSSNCSIYGRLYFWDAAMSSCPSGWHLPSSDEWSILLDFVPDSKELIQGGYTGFDILLGGAYVPGSGFAGINNTGNFWSSTESGYGGAGRRMFADYGYAGNAYNMNKNLGYSVRCVKN